MKKQLWLEKQEILLIKNSLALWGYRLKKAENVREHGHFYAAEFTKKQISDLQKRLMTLESK